MIRYYCFGLLFLLASCQKGTDSERRSDPGSDVVLTTFYPTTYFAQRIAGDHLKVECPLPEGADPIFWMPDAEAMRRYQAADFILLNGAQFEKWVDKVTLPSSRVVNTSRGLEDHLVRYLEATTHRHGPEGDHVHEGIDGHTWIDPLNAYAQAQEIAESLSKRWPEHADAFASGLASLEVDLLALDTRFQAFAKAWGKRLLLASHPAYNYLAKRYGFEIASLDLDPEQVDAASYEEIKVHKATVLLWEAEPSEEIAAKVSELGLRNVLVSPCEGDPGDGEDYLSVMRANLDRLEALKK